MEEGRAKAAAGGCAGLAVLAFGALTLRAQNGLHGRLQVLEQRGDATSGPQPDMPPGIYLRLETPESDSNERSVETHVVDANGVKYPMETGEFRGYAWIPLGYKRLPRSPRLVANVMAFESDRPSSGNLKLSLGKGSEARVKVGDLGPVPLRDFPTPLKTSLPLSKDAPFVLRRVGGKIRVEPIPGKMPAGDWELDALATPYAPTLTVPARYVSISIDGRAARATEDRYPWSARSGFPELRLPYPQDTDAVKLRLTITQSSDRVESVRIPGLRLVRRQGETVFDLPAPLRIPTRSGGTVVVSAPSSQRRESKVDHRTPTLWVTFETGVRPGNAAKPRIELVAPKSEALGLCALTIGQSVVAGRVPSGPVLDRSFTATLRLTWMGQRTIDGGVYTVPVR